MAIEVRLVVLAAGPASLGLGATAAPPGPAAPWYWPAMRAWLARSPGAGPSPFPLSGLRLGAVLQAAFVVAERGVLHVEQDRHHQRAEQPGGDAGQHHHQPEPGSEDAGSAAGDVRLLHRSAAGRHALLQQRLRRRTRSLTLADLRL